MEAFFVASYVGAGTSQNGAGLRNLTHYLTGTYGSFLQAPPRVVYTTLYPFTLYEKRQHFNAITAVIRNMTFESPARVNQSFPSRFSDSFASQ